MMRMVGEIAIAISSSLALSLIVKATVISASALIAAHIARRSRASIRHVLLAAAFTLLLALPLVSVAAPPREVSVSVPQAGSTVRVHPATGEWLGEAHAQCGPPGRRSYRPDGDVRFGSHLDA
jgi:hypothetical protein